jgi:hypothetical protein
VRLRELASHNDWSLAQHCGRFFQRRPHSMRCLEEGNRVFSSTYARPPLFTVFRPMWRKAVDRPRRQGESGSDGRSQRRASTGDWIDLNPLLNARLHQLEPRVGHRRRPGVRDERHLLSPGQASKQLRQAVSCVVFVKAQHRRVDAVVHEQPARPPRVFGRNDVGLPEHPQCPQRNVLEVPDGRRDEEQRAGHS